MDLQSFATKTVAFARKAALDIKELRNRVGLLNLLTTTDKTSVVNAINEVKSKTDALQTSQQNFIPISQKGAAGGVTPLGSDLKIAPEYLPSYVDDVLEGTYVSDTVFNNAQGNAFANEPGKIYVDTSITANKGNWRWTGTQYSKIEKAGIVLGETSDTAYRGDRGKLAYDHSLRNDNPHAVTKSQVGLANVQNYPMATPGTAVAGTSTTEYMSPALVKNAVDSWVGESDPYQEYINNL